MANNEGYHGYTNYETWNIKLWLDNDRGLYNSFISPLDGRNPQELPDVVTLADTLQEYFTDNAPDIPASTYGDLLGYALGRVNWYEIAEMIIEDAEPPEE